MSNFILSNHHVVLSVETSAGTKYAIIDTGNPGFSFFDDPHLREFKVENVSFPLADFTQFPFFRKTDWEKLSELPGMTVNGIIGYDFLSHHDLVIDFPARTILLNGSADDFYKIPLELHFNFPVVPLQINEVKINALFDTGAMHTVLNCMYKDRLLPLHEILNEYNPFIGTFQADLLTGDVTLGEVVIRNATIACANAYDDSLIPLSRRAGVKGILGISTLEEMTICISYRQKFLGIRKN